jgi:hypothetical protein
VKTYKQQFLTLFLTNRQGEKVGFEAVTAEEAPDSSKVLERYARKHVVTLQKHGKDQIVSYISNGKSNVKMLDCRRSKPAYLPSDYPPHTRDGEVAPLARRSGKRTTSFNGYNGILQSV